MTEPARRRRWSPARIRAAAWIAGAATAIGSGAALAAAPMPASDRATPAGQRDLAPPRRVIERHVIRRIVIVDQAPAAAPVSVPTIVVPAPSGGSAPAPPPAPAPAPAPTSTGGS
jgi:hypothetical protein